MLMGCLQLYLFRPSDIVRHTDVWFRTKTDRLDGPPNPGYIFLQQKYMDEWIDNQNKMTGEK